MGLGQPELAINIQSLGVQVLLSRSARERAVSSGGAGSLYWKVPSYVLCPSKYCGKYCLCCRTRNLKVTVTELFDSLEANGN
jgi:hypothetical protein